MIITDGKVTSMSLEELAFIICNNIRGEDASGCYDGSCPAADRCRHQHNGMIEWLRKVVAE